MKISEAEAQVRRERIIDTAFRLFCRDGIEKVTVAQVAKSAGVGESTIYRYFTSKTLLVLATLSLLWRSIGESLERMASHFTNYLQMTGLQQVAVHLEAFRNLYLENADYVMFSYEAKLYLQRNGITLSQEELDKLMADIKLPCIASLRKGQADGSIPLKEDAEDLFYAVWGSIRGYIVKIVIYEALCEDGNPWMGRYDLVECGILSALAYGVEMESKQAAASSLRVIFESRRRSAAAAGNPTAAAREKAPPDADAPAASGDKTTK